MEEETVKSVTWDYYYRRPFRCEADGYGMIYTADGHLALYLEEQPLTEALTAALNGEAVEYHGKHLDTRYYDEAQEICTAVALAVDAVEEARRCLYGDVHHGIAKFYHKEKSRYIAACC